MAPKAESGPKQVVYLWGAGATHAEAHRLGSTVSLLMRDTDEFGDGLTTRILARVGRKSKPSFDAGLGVDIEKLISLLSASGIEAHFRMAEELRRAYFSVLRASLAAANVLDKPQLAVRLLRMHRDWQFRKEVETLSGIITTNHDGLLQVACQRVFDGINVGFDFTSDDFGHRPSAPPILQLHGSFTWNFGIPIHVSRLRRKSKYEETVWIPPTILKESKTFPFNKLSGLAYELLARRCDVLRIIGSSLTQNDWNILSLIFNAQRHGEVTTGRAFVIELIMSQDAGDRIKRECAYLKNVNPIGFLTEGRFADYKEGPITVDSDLANPFAYWLNEKVRYHGSENEFAHPDKLGDQPGGFQ